MDGSRTVLATVDTADFSDCAKIGYRFCLYADGHVSAEHHCRWQGSRNGERYVTKADVIDVSTLTDDPDNDAEAALTAWIVGENPAADIECEGRWSKWRQTRRGYVMR